MSNRSATMPFRFVSCMELREVLGKRAMEEHRLLNSSRKFRLIAFIITPIVIS